MTIWAMPRDGAIIFSDLISKLDVLRVRNRQIWEIGVASLLPRGFRGPQLSGQVLQN